MRYSTLLQHPELDFAKGLADVRGWEVRTGVDDEKVGKVDDLVIDAGNRIRYLEVDTGGLFTAKRVLLPIGLTQLDEHRDVIWIPNMTKQRFKSLPEYSGDVNTLTEDYERRLLAAFPVGVTGEQAYSAERLYAPRLGRIDKAEPRIARVEEELAIGKRAVQSGEVLIRKTVETERVRRPVTRVREEVEVERRPVERAAGAADVDIREDEVRVPIMEEVVVVEKRPVVKEEVVIKKRAVEETEEVEADLRKERIEVDRDKRPPGERERRA